jgi:eukaryotic-like serine/threonine-protein kinase
VIDEERRRRIEEVCVGALARNNHDRAAFVAASCGDDATLRQQVDELLAHAQAAEGFLAMPVAAMAAQVLGQNDPMPMVGRQLGSYIMGSRLGAGGMGEVYRARDTKLGRDVAIKILPHAFTNDPERLTRFAREARMLATLNHPHVGAIYALEDIDGIRVLVLELVEGETLSEAIAQGPIPVREVLTMARQIATALDAAHEKGIVHRDLKPANVKIGAGGLVKVLDFGLAKAVAAEPITLTSRSWARSPARVMVSFLAPLRT